MSKHNFRVAIIGSIASGKSTALKIFKQLGIACYSADDVARNLLKNGEPAYLAILNHLGSNYLLANQELNRDKLRAKLITDPDFKLWLEALMHPQIKKSLKNSRYSSPYCVLEIPLLKNKQDYDIDNVLLIKTSPARQNIFLQNRHLNTQEIAGMLAIQQTNQMRIADAIIYNNGTIEDLKQNIVMLHNNFLQFIHRR